jgi:hypothetical protein
MGRADAKARAIVRKGKADERASLRNVGLEGRQSRELLRVEISSLLYELKKRDYPGIRPIEVYFCSFTVTRGGWQISSRVNGGRGGEYTIPVYLLANGSIVEGRTKLKFHKSSFASPSYLDGVRKLRAELL